MATSTITFAPGDEVRVFGGPHRGTIQALSPVYGALVKLDDRPNAPGRTAWFGLAVLTRITSAPGSAPCRARHLGDGLTRRQQGQEHAARATANADMLMPARGRHAAYIAWKPVDPETRRVLEAPERQAVA